MYFYPWAFCPFSCCLCALLPRPGSWETHWLRQMMAKHNLSLPENFCSARSPKAHFSLCRLWATTSIFIFFTPWEFALKKNKVQISTSWNSNRLSSIKNQSDLQSMSYLCNVHVTDNYSGLRWSFQHQASPRKSSLLAPRPASSYYSLASPEKSSNTLALGWELSMDFSAL